MPAVATFIPTLPSVGSKGVFILTSPFAEKLYNNEVRTCKSIRSIDDFFSEGQDPKKDTYTANGISDAEFEYDHTNEVPLIGLESESGDWLFVPARYIKAYPRVDGVQYRGLTLVVSLPLMPVTKDLTALKDKISEYCSNHIGVANIPVSEVETSKPISVTNDFHILTQDSRVTLDQGGNYYVQYQAQLIANQALIDKVAELEAFIIANLP